MSDVPRIAIVGVGSIGSRHINNLLAMGYQDLVGIDPRPMPHDERLPIVETFKDMEWWQPTHALICSPPEFHYHHAKYFVDRGIPTFIEKPMTVSKIEALKLCATADINESVLAVGYMERAHPTVNRVKSYAADVTCSGLIECYWRGGQKTYPLDVVAESSHAIDTAQFIFGKIRSVRARRITTVSADLEVVCGKSSRVSVVMHMDAEPLRRIRLDDGGHSHVFTYGASNEWDACYRTELQAFLDGKPLCTGSDGAAVVEVLEMVR